ncbi:MAG TPA: c-type cytochrome [Gemmatimonadaceae bacterium]|nr:c-type cytochrome [Gemmatimonadaceae bacterium]
MENMRLAAVVRHPATVFAALAFALAACGGGENGGTDTSAAMAPAATPPAGSTAAPAAGAPAGGATLSESQITPQMIAEGDSIFHGQLANGLCTTCHGQDAKGTQLAPDLTDNTWLNGDGSLGFIVNTVTNGVPTPKQHPGPMPPMGGSSFTQPQIQAVAAYVYSLSHPNVGKSG